ncbi:MAG: hypothetical protein Q7V43_00190 [Myxococcales bacterium]|nr:hypothetical protein [Myxococcales bacterium]
MRQRMNWWLAAAVATGCSSDPAPVGPGDQDSGPVIDVGVDRPDAPAPDRPDVPAPDRPDAPDAPDAGAADVPVDLDVPATGGSLAAVRAAITGTAPVTLTAALSDLVVTRTVAATPGSDGGVSSNDPAGFFVQTGMTGPAIFVAVDPASLSPAPQAGDRVAFTATRGELRAGARWITALSGYQRTGTGTALDGLRQDLSAQADLVTAIGDYEHELVRVQGTVAGNFASAGTGFESAQITTAGVGAAMSNLRVRVAAAVRASLVLRSGCTFTVTAPLWRFNAQVQVNAWTAADIALGACPDVTDAGAPDAGGTDAGTMDGGVGDAGSPDAPAPDVVLAPVDGAALDAGAEPAPTELWVLRVGAGTAALTNASTPAFIDRLRISDGTMAGASIALPTAASGANRPLTISGTATSDGQLTRSLDRRFVVLGGYGALPGVASVTGTASSAVPRVVARIAADGAIDTSTTLGAAFSGNNLRAAASADGASFWAAGSASGSGSIVYAPLGASASTPVFTTPSNGRFVALYDGTVFGAVGAGGQYGVFRVDGTTTTLLPGFPTTATPTPSPYGFVAFDRDATAGIDVIYQCDDRAVASGGGVRKWTLGVGTWTLTATLSAGLTGGCRSVTGFVSGANVTLLVGTSESPSRVVRFVDDGTSPASITATALRTAATNTVFRGVSLAPR